MESKQKRQAQMETSKTTSDVKLAHLPSVTVQEQTIFEHIASEYVECHMCRYMRRVDYRGHVESCPGCGDEEYIIDDEVG